MFKIFKTKYRVTRSWQWSAYYWQVDKKVWFWPFWVGYRSNLNSKQQALELIETLREEYEV